jgi:hypothetical protein
MHTSGCFVPEVPHNFLQATGTPVPEGRGFRTGTAGRVKPASLFRRLCLKDESVNRAAAFQSRQAAAADPAGNIRTD